MFGHSKNSAQKRPVCINLVALVKNYPEKLKSFFKEVK